MKIFQKLLKNSCNSFDLTLKHSLKLKIAIFANEIKFRELTLVNETTRETLQLADEEFIGDWLNDPCNALVSDIITNFNLNENLVTNNKSYTINAKCLELLFDFLVDQQLLMQRY